MATTRTEKHWSVVSRFPGASPCGGCFLASGTDLASQFENFASQLWLSVEPPGRKFGRRPIPHSREGCTSQRGQRRDCTRGLVYICLCASLSARIRFWTRFVCFRWHFLRTCYLALTFGCKNKFIKVRDYSLVTALGHLESYRLHLIKPSGFCWCDTNPKMFHVTQADFECAKATGLTRSSEYPNAPTSSSSRWLQELISDTRRARYTKYYHSNEYCSDAWYRFLYNVSEGQTIDYKLPLPECVILQTREIYSPSKDKASYNPSTGPNLSGYTYKSERLTELISNYDQADEIRGGKVTDIDKYCPQKL